MKKFIILILAGMFSMASFAHNPDVSNILLVEKENNIWTLQISAALTAFQQEVKTHFADTPYNTPEEFQEMVLQHIQNNLQMFFNGSENVILKNGKVQLGHETNVFFEVIGVPSDLRSAQITNTIFNDIYKNKGALFVFKENFAKKQFIFNEANNHQLSIKVSGNEFVEVTEQKASILSPILLVTLLGVLGLGILVQSFFKSKERPLLKVR